MDNQRDGWGSFVKGIGRELLGEATKRLGHFTLELTEAKLDQAADSLYDPLQEMRRTFNPSASMM